MTNTVHFCYGDKGTKLFRSFSGQESQKRMVKVVLVILLSSTLTYEQSIKLDSIWSPLKYFTWAWKGEGCGGSEKVKIHQANRKLSRQRFHFTYFQLSTEQYGKEIKRSED